MKNLKLLSKIAMAGAFLLLTSTLFAQSNVSTQTLTMGIDPVNLVNAVDSTATAQAVALNLTTSIAGKAVTGGVANSYVQVSLIVASSSDLRTLKASVTGVPAGTTLDVTTSTPNAGDGTFGTPVTGPIELVNDDPSVTLVNGMGSLYTGVAATNGYKMHWNWNAGAAGSYGSIYSTAGATATVTFTVSAGS